MRPGQALAGEDSRPKTGNPTTTVKPPIPILFNK
jgi:hypothetical protein